MKLVFRTLAFHILCIILFGLLYLLFQNHFIRDPTYSHNKNTKPELIDCLFLATTIQASVGYSDLYPITMTSKIFMIVQQFMMISANVFLLYIFTL